MVKHWVLLMSLMGVLNAQLSAQTKLSFKHVDTSHGLSQSWVRAIGQDQLGYIWVCTADGLNRYDGYSFEYIDVLNDEGKVVNKSLAFYCMLELQGGKLLFGASDGVYEFNSTSGALTKRKELPSGDIYSLVDDDEGLWIGSYNLFRYRRKVKMLTEYFPGQFEEGSLVGDLIQVLYRDSQNTIWIGTEDGLSVYEPTTDHFRSFTHSDANPNSLSHNSVRSLTEDNSGRIWVGTDNGLNLALFDEGKCVGFRQFVNQPNNSQGITNGAVLALSSVGDWLWIGTENGGLDRLDLQSDLISHPTFLHDEYDLKQPKGISNNSIHAIFEDAQSNVWLGTFSSGVDLYSPLERKFDLYQKQLVLDHSLINNQVNDLLEIDGKIWIGTEGGLSIFDPINQTFTNFEHRSDDPSSLSVNAVWEIFQDAGGDVWIGTWGGGLNMYIPEKNGFVRALGDYADPIENVFAIHEDKDLNLWIGTMGNGLLKLDKNRSVVKKYTFENSGIETNFVEEIFETSRGELLISNIKGVFRFYPARNHFERIVPSGSEFSPLIESNVHAIDEDEKGRLVLGTNSGLFVRHANAKDFTVIGMEEGLANNSIRSIVLDANDDIWVGTNRGLSQIRLGDDLELVSIKNYSVADGLQSNEFKSRSSLLSKSGILYFGGVKGFNTLDVNDLTQNTQPSRTLLTDFKVFNQSVTPGPNSILTSHINETKEIILDYNTRVFGFNYVGINYVSTEKNQYAYMLEGFDKDWNFVGNRREVTYTNIDPGDYVFKVKSANNDGLWNDASVDVKIVILPPFYLTPWAYFTYAVLVVLALYLFRKYAIIDIERKRDLQIESLERQKEAEISKSKLTFFTNISHEIRTPLMLIDGPVKTMIQRGDLSPKNKQQLEMVSRNARRLLHLINQLLDFRKIDTGHVKLHVNLQALAPIVRSVGEVFKQQSVMQEIDFRMEIEDETAKGWVDEEKLTTILYNLISNAFKYIGDKDTVTVGLKVLEMGELIEIKVSDNGVGISEESLPSIFNRFYQVENQVTKMGSSGIGLNIVKEYINLHHGQISVKSKLGEGSTFTITIPNKKSLYTNAELREEDPSAESNMAKALADADAISSGIDLHEVLLPQIEGHSNVLIVEDEKDLLKYLLLQLKDDFNLSYALNGKEALERASDGNFDLIISDIIMPEMDGLEMTRTLRGELETSHIPIIMLTAKATDQNVIEGVEQGADVYLAKPFNKELLKAHIYSLLSSRNKLRKLYQRQVRLDPKDLTITTLDEQFLNELLHVIEINIAEPDFDMEMLSREMAMSYRSLVRKVKSLTGQTSNEFLKSMRLKKAAQILEKSQMPIARVSTLIGFNDPAYFSRCFQKEFGIPPSRYFEMHRNA